MVILLALGVFVVVTMACGALSLQREGAPIRRPILDLALASIAGGALAAPLALPGFQLASTSVRAVSALRQREPGLPGLGLVIFQSFWGQPLPGSFVNAQGYFQEQWVYVGAIAARRSRSSPSRIRWRRAEVLGLAAAALVALAASVIEPVDRLLEYSS